MHLPGKKTLQASETTLEIVLLDATEQPIERPKKQRAHYSGKKKRHTQKAQLLADLKSRRILATDFATGSTHDFQLFKDSSERYRNRRKRFSLRFNLTAAIYNLELDNVT